MPESALVCVCVCRYDCVLYFSLVTEATAGFISGFHLFI